MQVELSSEFELKTTFSNAVQKDWLLHSVFAVEWFSPFFKSVYSDRLLVMVREVFLRYELL